MIYIGIPAHNEGYTLGPLLWRIRELLAPRGRGFRVVVVDDASTDDTAEKLEKYGTILPLILLRNPERRGYAASLERIVRDVVRRSDYPRRDALVTLQADFTDPPEAIPELIRRFESGLDLVLGAPRDSAGEGTEGADEADAREGDRGAENGGDADAPEGETIPAPRRVRLARAGTRWVARGLPRLPEVSDPYGSLRLYRLFALARALRDLEPEARLLRHEGWGANAELLFAVWPHVRRMGEIPAGPDYGRRYRDSRLRVIRTLRSVRRLARDPRRAAWTPQPAAEPGRR